MRTAPKLVKNTVLVTSALVSVFTVRKVSGVKTVRIPVQKIAEFAREKVVDVFRVMQGSLAQNVDMNVSPGIVFVKMLQRETGLAPVAKLGGGVKIVIVNVETALMGTPV